MFIEILKELEDDVSIDQNSTDEIDSMGNRNSTRNWM